MAGLARAVGRRAAASPALRALGFVWGAVLIAAVVGGAALQALGPPTPSPGIAPPDAPAAAPAAAGAAAAQAAAAPAKLEAAPTAGLAPPDSPATTIAGPDPALLEPSSVFQGGVLPKLGPGGRASRLAYAAPFDIAATAGRPRVAVLIAGIGLSQSGSDEAIRSTPGAISLAFSPYAFHPDPLLARARAAGHEILLGLPLEPDRYPIDDPGNRALLTGNPPALNAQRLEWALTRFAGYVGATGALGGLRGERFAASADQMGSVLRTLAARGLLYIDPRPGAAPLPFATGRGVDVLIDEPAPVRPQIDANLARLEAIARDRGSALGLVDLPSPVALDRLAVWAAGLEQRGLVLAPVSAVVTAPPLGGLK